MYTNTSEIHEKNEATHNPRDSSAIMPSFFLFDNIRLSVLVHFSITSIVLYLGPEFFLSSWRKANEAAVIDAPCGRMIGQRMTTRLGRYVDSYTAIPYAQPPVGQLRFRRPQPLESAWNGVFEAKRESAKCVQLTVLPFFSSGQEDCLYLNVFRPSGDLAEQDSLLPVMVWFHGGGFTSGDASTMMHGPGHLLDRDVVLVTANYRLGILGFLTLGKDGLDSDIVGNQGLWDQVEVLKWVRKNIRSFGGNPKKVTIFGSSAGGFSVSYHLVAKASRGLFQAAIIQGGPIHAPFLKADMSQPLPLIHKQYVAALGCPVDPDQPEVSAACLRAKTPEQLMENTFLYDQCSLFKPGTLPYPPIWAHADDSGYSSAKSFFSSDPLTAIMNGQLAQVPVMLGHAANEGLLMTANLMNSPEQVDMLHSQWNTCGPVNLLGTFFDRTLNPDAIRLANQVKDFYFGDASQQPSMDRFDNLTNMLGDGAFAYGTHLMARQLVAGSRSPVFRYVFAHQGSFSMADFLASSTWKLVPLTLLKFFGLHLTKEMGAAHSDEVLFLFRPNLPLRILDEASDKAMLDAMVDLWVNFATFHNPTPMSSLYEAVSGGDWKLDNQWPRVASTGADYVVLKNGLVSLENDADFDARMAFWEHHVQPQLGPIFT